MSVKESFDKWNIDRRELFNGEVKQKEQTKELANCEERVEEAEARTQQAETRTEQAKTRTEQAEIRTEQAETRVEQAKTRTEQAEVRTEEAETRSELVIRNSEITYRRLNAELEQRVIERTTQLEVANKELEAFSYSVSHDLRAPLRHVLGFVELLRKDLGPSLSGKNIDHLATISTAATRMGDLIDDLLAFARIGKIDMKKTKVNTGLLVQEILKDFEAETRKRNIQWEIHPLPAAHADLALLRMVLVNLISNAVKFTGARAQPKIEIGCAPSGESETVIFVRDNGAGFDPRYVGKLFGVFQRLHSQEDFEGTGIGLANVQRIIHRHGGRIWAEGAVDAGATFYFSIPKSKEDTDQDADNE